MTQAKFIVLEGLDGSGKSTQLSLLQRYCEAQSITFRTVHFPRLDTAPYGKMIAEFLRGEYGKIRNVHPRLVALLFAGDRKDFASTIENWLMEGHLVIADRYVFSNIAFQCAKCVNATEKQALAEWILELEFGYNALPKPDLSLLLQLPASTAVSAVYQDEARNDRAYLDGTADIHESSASFQHAVEQEYEGLVQRREDFVQVACCDVNGNRLGPDDLHASILKELKKMHIF
jgi:dTMP kinase